MTLTTASLLIAAPPSKVRKIFLDWPSILEFDTSYMTSLTILAENSPSSLTSLSSSSTSAKSSSKIPSQNTPAPKFTTESDPKTPSPVPTSPSKEAEPLPGGRLPHPSKRTGEDVVPGDVVYGTFWGGSVDLHILSNSPSKITWRGQWKGMFAIRSFSYEAVSFEKEEEMVEGTRFTQTEEAVGVMGAILLVDRWVGNSLQKKFSRFNEDLKVFCETGRRNEG